ncbi:MAG: hypothetical protein RPR40_01645 [Bermanella sp.]
MKILLVASVLSFTVGLWFGVNIGKGNALYDNPLADPAVLHDAHDSADEAGLIEQGEEFLDRKKTLLKDKVKGMVDDL